MSGVSLVQKVENILITIDHYSDYVPFWSSVTNLVDIFEKGLGEWVCGTEALKEHEYCKYIHDKPYWRCTLLILPIIGNVIIAIYDYFEMRYEEKVKKLDEEAEARLFGIFPLPNDPVERERALQNGREVQARQLGIHIPLGTDPAERRRLVDEADARQMAAAKANALQILGAGIQAFAWVITDFNDYIQNPDQPVHIPFLALWIINQNQPPGQFVRAFNGTPLENLNFYWETIIKTQFSLIDRSIVQYENAGMMNDPIMAQKKREFEIHRTQLIQMREDSYVKLVRQLTPEQVLEEMRAQYSSSFTEEEEKHVSEHNSNAMPQMALIKAIQNRRAKIQEPYRKIEFKVFASLNLLLNN